MIIAPALATSARATNLAALVGAPWRSLHCRHPAAKASTQATARKPATAPMWKFARWTWPSTAEPCRF
jgi:hypothetical protein